MILRKIEAHISIGHISTAISGSDAYRKAIAIIRYAIRGAKGVPLVQVGYTPPDTNVVHYMRAQIRAKKDHPNVRLLEKMILTFPNEATEEQCREIAETYLKKVIGDSAAVGICALHMAPGNKHAHVYLLDGLESQKAAQQRAAERDANRKDGKKTRVRRRDHLRFKDLFYCEPDQNNPSDKGIKMKSHIRQQWADHVNDYCRKNGIPVHYEHRSRAERGLPGDGTFHLGPQNHAMMQKIESAERYEMLTGHLVKRNLPNEGAVERAIKVIDENKAVLAKRESVQNKWSMSEKSTSDSINHARRQIPINMNATNENIIQIEEKTQNSVRGQT